VLIFNSWLAASRSSVSYLYMHKFSTFIEEKEVVEKILRHCDLWQEQEPHPPPNIRDVWRILDGGGGKRSEKVSLCKEFIISYPYASEKRKSLSA
jgi:hypothetical protein